MKASVSTLPQWLSSQVLSLDPCGRFAPTPTGELHIGNGYTALLAHVSAKARGWKSILRIDDLDPQATPKGCVEQQMADLAWLGLEYDESPLLGGPRAPYDQGSRAHIYKEALQYLNQKGLLYECQCSRKELVALAPHASDEGPIYPGLCRPSISPDQRSPIELESKIGKSTPNRALRFDVQGAIELGFLPNELIFEDEVMGLQTFSLSQQVGDFVVRRRDGICAYQLACIVDDVSQRCALVLRGADLLTSTARQLALAYCLDLPQAFIPSYAHIGLMVDAQGERLAKRNRKYQLSGLRSSGISAYDLRLSLAQTWGAAQPTGDLKETIKQFNMSQLPQHAVHWTPSSFY